MSDEEEATGWRVLNMRRCPPDNTRWVADVIYEYRPSRLHQWLFKAQPKVWLRMVISGHNGAWYWLPEVRRLKQPNVGTGVYLVDNHEWDLNLALDRERDEAMEREHVVRITFENAKTTAHSLDSFDDLPRIEGKVEK